MAEAFGDLVAGWVPIHEPELTARLGYLDGTFPPGRHRDDDHHDARAALLAAEAEAARLLRSGPGPVAVTGGPASRHDHDDLVVVSAPFDDLERAARPRLADDAPHARLLVVTWRSHRRDGDPDASADGDADGLPAGGAGERRAARWRRAVTAVRGRARAAGDRRCVPPAGGRRLRVAPRLRRPARPVRPRPQPPRRGLAALPPAPAPDLTGVRRRCHRRLARKMWRTLEPYHGLSTSRRHATRAYAALGVTGRAGYFASRAAAMGPVPPRS